MRSNVCFFQLSQSMRSKEQKNRLTLIELMGETVLEEMEWKNKFRTSSEERPVCTRRVLHFNELIMRERRFLRNLEDFFVFFSGAEKA